MSFEPAVIPASAVHRLRACHIDQEFEIRVAWPVAVEAQAGLRVVYVMDGDLFFGTVVEMTRLMHQLFRELPPLLVVGVGYGAADPRVQGELRNREFTPTSDEAFERMGKKMMPDWQPLLPDGQRMGGAAAFLAFLQEEVSPLVAAEYAVADGGHTLFGASLGGLFALYALLAGADAFDNYVIASPAIWWDGEMLFDVESRLAEAENDVAAAVFMGVGSLEEGTGIPCVDRLKTVTNVREMVGRLAERSYPSLSVAVHVFENETHTSVVPAVLTRGLRKVYGPGR